MTPAEAVKFIKKAAKEHEDVGAVVYPRLARLNGKRLEEVGETDPQWVVNLAEMVKDLLDQEDEINDLVNQRREAGLAVEEQRRARAAEAAD